MKFSKLVWNHYLFYTKSEAEDFFVHTGAEYLLNLERYTIYIDYEVFDVSKREPTIGFNIEPNELQYARNYKSFLNYERSAEPFNIFGNYKL